MTELIVAASRLVAIAVATLWLLMMNLSAYLRALLYCVSDADVN